MNSEDFVQVYTAYGQLAGDIIRLYLEAGGLQVKVLQESAGEVYGLTVGRLGEVRILVPAQQEQEALQRLREMEDNPAQTGNLEDYPADSAEEDLPDDQIG